MENFDKILAFIYKRSIFQKKKIQGYLALQGADFFQEAEQFASEYLGYLENQGMPMESAVEKYLKLCSDTMKCQVEFMQTGKYPSKSSDDIFGDIYNNAEEMKSYMIGLAISQFLWKTHYAIYSFFVKYLKAHCKEIHAYLEIGPGHGLFLNKTLEYLGSQAKITVVDISPVSINIARSIIDYFKHGHEITYHTTDIFKFNIKETYDFITLGEVLEHVRNPDKLLLKLQDLLKSEGRVFISTCVNGPAIDHVYHFKAVTEIRDLIAACGFAIESEHVLPVEDLPIEEIKKKMITINYCAILMKNVYS